MEKQTEISVVYKCEKQIYSRKVFGWFILIARKVKERVGEDEGYNKEYSFEIKEKNLKNSFDVITVSDDCSDCECDESSAKCSENKNKSEDEAWEWVYSKITEHEEELQKRRMDIFDAATQKVRQLNSENSEILPYKLWWTDKSIHTVLRWSYGLHFSRFLSGERGNWDRSSRLNGCDGEGVPLPEYHFVTTNGARSPSGGGDDGLCDSSSTSLSTIGYKNLNNYL